MRKKNRVYHMIDGEILTDADFERMADDVATRDLICRSSLACLVGH